MSSSLRLVVVVVSTSLLTAGALSVVSQPAHAEAPRAAVCTPVVDPGVKIVQPQVAADATAAWISAQLVAGRTTVIAAPFWGSHEGLCAW